MLDGRETDWERFLNPQTVATLCDRRFGIGADGLIVLAADTETDFRMVYFNADGNESTMCGNGGRCLVAFARARGIEKEPYTFFAIDGVHHARIHGTQVELEMTPPQGFRQEGQETYWIDTGSPHYVAFQDRSLDDFPVVGEGRAVRYAEPYAPGGTNANFVNILADNQLRVRTYERGVEDETLSCGTGVTACAYVYARLQNGPSDTTIQLQTEGGTLSVQIEKMSQAGERITLIGPAEEVYSGTIELPPA